MNNKNRRSRTISKAIAILIAVLMVISLLPISALADAPLWRDQVDEVGMAQFFDAAGGSAGEGDFIVSTSKTIEQTGENEFEITLRVQTTVDTTTIEVEPDAAVVLVIDTSGSMAWSPAGYSTQRSDEFSVPLNTNGTQMTFVGNSTIASSSRAVYRASDNKLYAARNSSDNYEWYLLGSNTFSSSMSWAGSGTRTLAIPASKTRVGEAKAAAIAFLDSFVKDAGDAKRMVSIVTFSTTSDVKQIKGYNWADVTISTNMDAAKAIINGLTATGGTFTQGGLMHARNLYIPANAPKVDGEVIANRFVVMLTDGNPTYSNSSNTSTALTQLTRSTGSNDGGGSENILSVSVGSNRAAAVATQIKNGGGPGNNYTANLYTIGFGISGDSYRRDGTTTGTTGAVTGNAWLTSIADKHFAASSAGDLLDAFEKIAETIVRMASAWTVTDPMAQYIEFDGFVTAPDGTFSESDGTITWNIKDATPNPRDGESRGAGTKVYTYELSYRVKLDNISGYMAESVINTNDPTTLTYVVDSKQATEYREEDFITVDFSIPQIHGFDAPLRIIKFDEAGAAVTGAIFNLYLGAAATGDPYASATSLDDGRVNFGHLPSGHTYTLVETYAPSGCVRDENEYVISVDYGMIRIPFNSVLTGRVDGTYQFVNRLERADIEITKEATNAARDGSIGMLVPEAKYRLTVRNTGYQPLKGVVVTDTLGSAAASIVIDSVIYGSPGAPMAPGTDYTATLSGSTDAYTGFVMEFKAFNDSNSLPRGAVITIEYTVVYDQVINSAVTTDRDNTARVGATSTVTGDPVNDTSVETVIQPGATLGAEIVKSVYSIEYVPVHQAGRATNDAGQYIVENGERVIYAVTVTNTGDITLYLTGISDSLQPDAARCDEHGSTAAENLVDIASPLGAGESLTVYYIYIVTDRDNGALVNNTATATFSNFNDISDSETVQVVAPVVTLSKTITSAADSTYNRLPLFSNGATITFAITIRNIGGADANGTLSDVLSKVGDATYLSPGIIFYTLNSNNEKIPLTGTSNITIPAGGAAVVFYDIIAEGQTDAGWEDDVNDAIQAVEDAYAAYQEALTAAQGSVNAAAGDVQSRLEAVAAAEQTLNAAIEAYFENGAQYVYEQIPVYDNENEITGYVDGEIIDVITPDPAAMNEDGAVAAAQSALEAAERYLADAETALANANGVLQALIDDGEDDYAAEAAAALEALIGDGPTQIFVYSNYAGYGDFSHESVEFAVDYEKQPFLTLNKVVRVNNGNWTNFAVAYEGDAVEFGITITNIGTEASAPMVLRDTFDGDLADEFDIPAIEPGIANAYTVALSSRDYDWSGVIANDSFTAARVATNTAQLGSYIDGEFDVARSSSASVVIPPQPAAVLSIDKLIRVAGSGARFEKFAEANSNSPVNFEFQVTITNSGSADATVSVSDFFASDAQTSLVGELAGDIDNGYVTIPANRSVVLTMVAAVGADMSETNIVSYTAATDQNVINPYGQSSATAAVYGIPHSILSVEKKVYNNTIGSWDDAVEYYVSGGDTKDAIFRITVTNEGRVTGQFTLADRFDGRPVSPEDLYLSPFFLPEDRLADSGVYDAANGFITVRGGASLNLYYLAEGLEAGEYINNVAIAGYRGEQPGEWEIYDTIKPADAYREDYSTDAAMVTIYTKTEIMIIVGIDKKVALAGSAEDPATLEEEAWQDNISVISDSVVGVFYRITITRSGNMSYSVRGSIHDLLAGMEIELGSDQAFFEIGEGETAWTTYLSAALPAAGTYVNAASIAEEWIAGEIDNETNDVTLVTNPRESAATVTITPPLPYEEPGTGSLQVTKEFNGVANVPGNWSATITVTGPGGYDQSALITADSRTVAFRGLDEGTYTVTEVGSGEIPDYEFISADGEGSYSVSANNTTQATITNTYSDSNVGGAEIDIFDEGPPIAMMPPDEEDFEFLDDPDLPTSMMPQTGVTQNSAPWLFGIFSSLMAAGGLLAILNRGKKDDESVK